MDSEPFPHQARRGADDPVFDDDRFSEILSDDERPDGKGRIRCPHCGWTPRSSSRWMCTCGCVWNTFDTGGTCPECAQRWLETQCLACHAWSPHLDWYADDEPSPS